MGTKVTMPQLGESVVEGTVGRWLVSEGDVVQKDQPIVEILTDKADSEVPSPVAGTLKKQFAQEDDVIAVGEALCEIDDSATTPKEANGGGGSAPVEEAATGAAPKAPTSPAIRKLAREKDVDLSTLRGSGDGGRITKDDVVGASSSADAPSRPATPPPPAEAPQSKSEKKSPARAKSAGGTSGAFRLPPYVPKDGDEIVPFSRRRRIIADHMVYSKQTSPDVVTFAEVDLNATTKLRNEFKGQYKKEGISLTFLAFSIAAVAHALKEFPEVNARVLDDAYVKLAAINIGIAVDTPEGLVVPVIRNADGLTVRGIARAISDLAERARDGKLKPDDLSSKTFTVSNPGRRGNLVGGAIISQPNVGILRLGTIKKRVVVVEHEDEDLMAIHPMMQMALTYDHRIVDGVNANGFLYRVGEILEQAEFDL